MRTLRDNPIEEGVNTFFTKKQNSKMKFENTKRRSWIDITSG